MRAFCVSVVRAGGCYICLLLYVSFGVYARHAMAGALKPEDLFYEKMRYLEYSVATYSKNIANSDTPGYKAKGLPSFENSRAYRALQLKATSPRHLLIDPLPPYREIEAPTRGEVKPNGNTVFPDDQLYEINKRELRQRETVNILNKMKRLRGMVWGEGK